MIGNITFNNYQNRQNPSFSGKSFVQMNCLGEKYLVPKPVANVRRSVKNMFCEQSNTYDRSNTVNVWGNLFLGIAHAFSDLEKTSSITLGKINKRKREWLKNLVGKINKSNELDLSLVEVEMKKNWTVAKSNPVKFAKNSPKSGEAVYIVGYHPDFEGPKVIPAIYREQCEQGLFKDSEWGANANYFKIEADILKNKIVPHGLSGSAIVNNKGELIGTMAAGLISKETSKAKGTIYGIGIDSIKEYLHIK